MDNDETRSQVLALQLETESIDEQLQTVQNQIDTLISKQEELVEQKQKLSQDIANLQEQLQVPSEKVDWSKDDFSWSCDLKKTLNDKFHIDEFRKFQKETMNVTLSNKDCILIMPTGAGKSLCFQLPTLISHGFSVIISPLVSLMEDQLLALKELDINGIMLNASSSMKYVTEMQNQMVSQNPSFKLLYVTPEKIAKSKRFMSKLEKAYSIGNINRIVIDEVHCTSHWGHDFRPDYKILGILKRQFPNVPILGLTATASEKVLNDVKDILNLDHTCIVFRASFNRPNLFYEVYKTSAEQKDLVKDIAKRIKEQFYNMSGIVYCFSRKDSEAVASLLVANGVRSHCYHSELPPVLKSNIHKSWSKGDLQVVVATIAFGMGIDKPDVRFVIHYSISKSMENYYQESGRAGRDSQKAYCILYFRFQDIFRQSGMVFQEKTGLQKLYNILSYCVNKQKCRRSLIGSHFAENWSASKCQLMCDNCKRSETHNISQRNIKDDAETIIEILRKAAASEERFTPTKVIDAWLGKSKTTFRPAKISTYRREECESILTKLLLEQIVREDYHFTPYNTITYLLPGPRWLLLKRDQILVKIDVAKKKTGAAIEMQEEICKETVPATPKQYKKKEVIGIETKKIGKDKTTGVIIKEIDLDNNAKLQNKTQTPSSRTIPSQQKQQSADQTLSNDKNVEQIINIKMHNAIVNTKGVKRKGAVSSSEDDIPKKKTMQRNNKKKSIVIESDSESSSESNSDTDFVP